MYIKLIGIKVNQHKDTSKSKRYRGYLARRDTTNHIKYKFTNWKFVSNNVTEIKQALKIIIKFSPRKINENSNPPYSTLNPDTNSDSLSERSNGGRFLSITRVKKSRIRIKNLKNKL